MKATKATELRIGNLFIGYDNKVFKWSLDEFVMMLTDCDIDEIIKEPITLTEEWLLKFGFDQREDYFFLKENSKYYFFWNEKDGAGITTYEKVIGDIVFDEITIIKKLKYVHQLQNLFFALTGSELTIKE